MRGLRRLRRTRHEPTSQDTVIVTITGGLGSQILSAAAYFEALTRYAGVGADLSYFDRPAHKAALGEGVSQWNWDLGTYGLTPGDFSAGRSDKKSIRIDDGPLKMQLALAGLKRAEIQARFSLPDSVNPGQLKPDTPYACLHIRQGDYLNVASHLIRPEDLEPIANRIQSLVRAIVVTSDSPLPEAFVRYLDARFDTVNILVDAPLAETHAVMRQANLLVCANSTLSLTAAALNSNGLVIIPGNWFGGAQDGIEKAILSQAPFNVFILE